MVFFGHLGAAAVPGSLGAAWRQERDGRGKEAPDLRWLLAGSILPDLIDKPLGQGILKPYFRNGRIYGHTALFAALVLLAGISRLKREADSRLLLLAMGVASHQLVDRIWEEPETFLWPALGPFLRHPKVKSLWGQVLEALRDPHVWAGEAVGLALTAWSLHLLGVEGSGDLRAFLRRGLTPRLARPRQDL